MRRRLRAFSSATAAILISGCAGYSPQNLPTAPDAALELIATSSAPAASPTGLDVSTSTAQSLDEEDAMTLAVARDPDLRAARLKAGVAEAQLFAAGLPPDPRLSASVGRGPEFTGYSLGVSEDVQAFAVRPAVVSEARAHHRQVDLTILWKERRTALAAGRLFLRLLEDENLQDVIERNRKLLAQQYELDQADFQQSAAAVSRAAADLTVLSDADARSREVQLDADAARHALDYMLGLPPEARPQLKATEAPTSQPLSEEQFKAAVAALAAHRVDLLALQAGYESQEQRLRAAVLAQFPALDVGVQWGQDPAEGKHTTDLTLGVGLPIFNRNKGRVAVERASRESLRAEYQARLDRAANDADRLWRASRIMSEQLARLQAQTAALKTLARAAEQQFRSGQMDTGAYVGLETSLLKDEEETIHLQAAQESDLLALRASLGLPPSIRW